MVDLLLGVAEVLDEDVVADGPEILFEVGVAEEGVVQDLGLDPEYGRYLMGSEMTWNSTLLTWLIS